MPFYFTRRLAAAAEPTYTPTTLLLYGTERRSSPSPKPTRVWTKKRLMSSMLGFALTPVKSLVRSVRWSPNMFLKLDLRALRRPSDTNPVLQCDSHAYCDGAGTRSLQM